MTTEGPHSIELEQAVLGALLLDNSLINKVGSLRAEEFFDPLHAQIFETIRIKVEAGDVADPITLNAAFKDHPDLAPEMPAQRYVALLVSKSTMTANVSGYAAELRDLAGRRRLLEIAADLVTAANEPQREPHSTARSVTEALDEVAVLTQRDDRRTRSSAYEANDELLTYLSDDTRPPKVVSGLTTLDNMTGGWHRGHLVLIGGRPSMGKSAVGLSLLLSTARRERACLLFTLEMTAREITARMATDRAWDPECVVSYSSILQDAKLSNRDLERVSRAAAANRSLPLVIDDASGLTVSDVRRRSRKEAEKFARQGKRLEVVMIDHIGLLEPSGRYAGNRVHEVTEISKALKGLAKELELSVVAQVQLNRGTEGRENKRPTLADLRDSGSLEQDADAVLLLYREAYYLERDRYDPGDSREALRVAQLEQVRHLMEIGFVKNRSGRTGWVKAFADIGANAIRDAA